MQLGELQERIAEVKKLNTEVIAIASKVDQQDVEKSKRVLKITYTLIPKPNRKVAEDFGVWNKYKNRAVATVILDENGRYRFYWSIEVGTCDIKIFCVFNIRLLMPLQNLANL